MPTLWHRVTAVLAINLMVAVPVFAADIKHLEATHDDGRYKVFFEVVLDAERHKVWQIMTDYERLPRVSKLIVESRILKREDANRHRLDVTFHACVLIFCKTMKKVVDIQTWPENGISVIGDPELSDFSLSVERWRVVSEGTTTRLYYYTEMVPKFFIPPLIGPWLVKSFLRREIRTTALLVEQFAHDE